ncbi:MAG: hypothetical protein CM15mP46_6260 [Alphaproteobacteria bacterium]|nr:MAG: hypothetical protein CM15mP46_6260 [Alphaproteobacteria bacterium]
MFFPLWSRTWQSDFSAIRINRGPKRTPFSAMRRSDGVRPWFFNFGFCNPSSANQSAIGTSPQNTLCIISIVQQATGRDKLFAGMHGSKIERCIMPHIDNSVMDIFRAHKILAGQNYARWSSSRRHISTAAFEFKIARFDFCLRFYGLLNHG